MKTSLKILILFLGVIIAVGGVLIYMKIIMSPPIEMDKNNQYTEYLDGLIQNLKDSSVSDPETQFQIFSDMTDRLHREQLVTQEEGKKSYNEFILVYAPKFSEWCFAELRKPEWNSSLLDWMVTRINNINAIKINGNEYLIIKEVPETGIDLEKIKQTVKKYHEAMNLVSSHFLSLTDSQDKVAKSKEFLNDEYLKNNIQLRNSLNALPSKLEAAHFGYLSSQVNSMENYRNHTKESYDRLSDNVLHGLNEYQSKANSVYGRISDVASLKSKASSHMREAEDYFDLLEYEEKSRSSN